MSGHDLRRMTRAVQNRAKITVVDDDTSVREALQGLLRSAGFDAEVFASAAEFLNSSGVRVTACLVLDVRMPGMSGVELQKRLIASGCTVPIIFISTYADEEVRSLVLERGAVDFLQKPFTKEALLSAIERARGTAALPDP